MVSAAAAKLIILSGSPVVVTIEAAPDDGYPVQIYNENTDDPVAAVILMRNICSILKNMGACAKLLRERMN